MGVEYLFMGNASRINGLAKEDKYDFDFRNLGIGVLNAQPQLNQRSGRYRQKNTVPI
jgi:hypothetical protein